MSEAEAENAGGRSLAPRRLSARALKGHWPIVLATAALAFLSIRSVLDKNGGVPAVPLDDAYIHFQYARSFAEGTPLVYSPGCGAVAGATSLLWPILLAPGYALGSPSSQSSLVGA